MGEYHRQTQCLARPRVNMTLRNLTLYHILKYLAESTDNSLVLDEEAKLVVIKSTDPFEDPFEHLKWVTFITS